MGSSVTTPVDGVRVPPTREPTLHWTSTVSSTPTRVTVSNTLPSTTRENNEHIIITLIIVCTLYMFSDHEDSGVCSDSCEKMQLYGIVKGWISLITATA